MNIYALKTCLVKCSRHFHMTINALLTQNSDSWMG